MYIEIKGNEERHMKRTLSNLKKAINELNSPCVIDGEEMESEFSFKLREGDTYIEVYDENENYYIGYLDNQICMLADLQEEFGVQLNLDNVKDDVMDKLSEALKKDLGEDCYFEWKDNVTLFAPR